MPEQSMAPVKDGRGQLSRWDPGALFDEIQSEMERFWNRWPMLGPWPLVRPLRRIGLAPTTWAPRMDVYEKDNNLVVKAELPGIRKEDVAVELDEGDLVIRGESKGESEVKEENFYRMERTFGSFYRRLPLPFEAQPDRVEATFADGILEVRVPRPAEAKPAARKIQVK